MRCEAKIALGLGDDCQCIFDATYFVDNKNFCEAHYIEYLVNTNRSKEIVGLQNIYYIERDTDDVTLYEMRAKYVDSFLKGYYRIITQKTILSTYSTSTCQKEILTANYPIFFDKSEAIDYYVGQLELIIQRHYNIALKLVNKKEEANNL